MKMEPLGENSIKTCDHKKVMGVGYETILMVGDPGMLFDRLPTLYRKNFLLWSSRALR